MTNLEKVTLLEDLLNVQGLTKSEVRVIYFCWEKERDSKEIRNYIHYQSPNAARLLVTMTRKELLVRRKEIKNGVELNSYLYASNCAKLKKLMKRR